MSSPWHVLMCLACNQIAGIMLSGIPPVVSIYGMSVPPSRVHSDPSLAGSQPLILGLRMFSHSSQAHIHVSPSVPSFEPEKERKAQYMS